MASNSIQSCLSTSSSSFFFFIFVFSSLLSLSFSDPRISEAALICGNSTAPRNAAFIPTFVKEMEILSDKVAVDDWGISSVNSTTPIYGLAQCHADLSHTDCLYCYAVSRTRIPHCLPSTSARLYLDGCFLRYDNYNFFNESIDPVLDLANCSSEIADLGKEKEFQSRVWELIENVTETASLGRGFAMGEVRGVFGLAQCWKSLRSSGCRECLGKAAKEVRGCVPSREGRGLNAGCYLRYSTEKFFNNGVKNLQQSSGNFVFCFLKASNRSGFCVL